MYGVNLYEVSVQKLSEIYAHFSYKQDLEIFENNDHIKQLITKYNQSSSSLPSSQGLHLVSEIDTYTAKT